MVLQAVLVLGSAIGNELPATCGCFDEMVAGLMRLVCTAKPKIRVAASKALQKALTAWPAETAAAISRADDEWRTHDLVQKLLVPPASVTSSQQASFDVAIEIKAGIEKDADESLDARSISKKTVVVPTEKTSSVSSFEDIPVGKSTSKSSMLSADAYGSDISASPYSSLLDLLNSYVI